MGATVSAQHGLIPTYRIRISYTYIVNGEYYAGSNKTIFLRKSSAETMASGLKGRTVMLRYPSSEPARSALLQRDQFGWPN
jgi:hypothetical protein